MSSIKKAAYALEQFYHESATKLLKFLLKHNGGNMEVAESVLQDTLIAVYKSFHTFHKKSTFFTWVCKIALNKLADYYRGQVNSKSHLVVPLANEVNRLIDPALTPEEKLALDDLRAKVNTSLNLLPPEYRRLLHFKYYLDLSNQEISLKLNLTPRSLEGRLYRAKRLLAKIYPRS